MKVLYTIFTLGLLIISNSYSQTADNKQLEDMLEMSNFDKFNEFDLKKLIHNDSLREEKVYQFIYQDMLHTSNDYYRAGLLLMKGIKEKSPSMVLELIKKATDMDISKDKSILAIAIDRELLSRGEKQIYGTQFYQNSDTGLWSLYPIDTTLISDAERKLYKVESYKNLKLKIKNLNLSSITNILTKTTSINEIKEVISKEFKNLENRQYNVSEEEINNLGYELVNQGKNAEALEIFYLNTELYPNGYNTWDSLGECLLKFNKNEEAKLSYQKSYLLNKYNINAKNLIQTLTK